MSEDPHDGKATPKPLQECTANDSELHVRGPQKSVEPEAPRTEQSSSLKVNMASTIYGLN